MKYSRPLLDVGLLTNQRDDMLSFWRDEIGLPLTQELQPVEGVVQYKLDLCGAVLKLNCVESPLPQPHALNGLRMLLLARDDIESPVHLHDPDGNRVCLVPPGYRGISNYGVHLAVSDEAAFHQFFSEALNLEAGTDRSYNWAGTVISFAWSPDVIPGADTAGAGYYYLTAQVMDTRAAHDDLLARGANEHMPPGDQHTTTDSVISFIRDPDGNTIEISQRPDLVEAALSRTKGDDT